MALLAACASPSDGDTDAAGAATGEAGDPAAGGGITQADFDLQLTVDRGAGTAPDEWTLTCAGLVEGSHPDPDAACRHLSGLSDPFAPVDDLAVCTQQYGGPQTAHVEGRWAGEPVDVQLSRTNGCLIAQWDSLGPLLPVPVG
jgi:hypothetical protein